MSDGDKLVLHLLAIGRLRVDFAAETVHAYEPCRKRWVVKKETTKHGSTRVRFHFHIDGFKTTVYKSRLFFLARTRSAPAVVDHANGDRTDDSVENLKPHTRYESDRQGYEVQRRKRILDTFAYFDYIAFWDEEPPTLTDVPRVTTYADDIFTPDERAR